MNGIKMSDCRFYTDEASGTVVCVIPNTRDMLLDFICEHCIFSDFDLFYALEYKLKDELRMPSSFMGKAVCNPEDIWDEETGRILAFSRAKEKCYKSFFRRANKFAQALDRRLGAAITNFNDFGLKLEHKQKALHKTIIERTGMEEKDL